MRLLWFGSYAKGEGYPRTETLLAGLRSLGHEVREVHAPLLEGAAHRVETARGGGALRLAWRQARAAAGDELCARTDAAPVQRVGKVLVLWRPRPEDGGAI